jgi:hypothetical protein
MSKEYGNSLSFIIFDDKTNTMYAGDVVNKSLIVSKHPQKDFVSI